MAVTRDPNFPEEVAQLAASFGRCADGYSGIDVLNAALQLLSASIGHVTSSQSASLDETEQYAEQVCHLLRTSVRLNYRRTSQPTDVEVRAS